MTAPGSWPTGEMTAATVTASRRIDLLASRIPGEASDAVLVAPMLVGLCGTDRELFLGEHPYLIDGLTTLPFVPGHEWVGRVVAIGGSVLDLRVGDIVVGDPFVACGVCGMCRASRRNLCERRSEIGVRGSHPGALADYIRVPERNCTRVPDGVDPRAALLTEPTVTVLRGFERVRCAPADRVLVVGAGTLGLIAVMVACSLGSDVEVVDVDDAAVAVAVAAGARSHAAGRDGQFDVVVEASGSVAGCSTALRAAGPGARVALLGMPADTVPLDVSRLVAADVEIHAVLGGVEQYARAVALVKDGVIDPALILGERYPLEDVARAFDDLSSGSARPPKRYVEIRDAAASSGARAS